MQARFDKEGRRLADTGHGCGCQICADTNAPRYERREGLRGAEQSWTSARRRLARLLKKLRPDARPQTA